jgi:hypothetical protein
MLTDPLKLAEGKKWLNCLKEAECPNFRAYTDYIREATQKGHYTYDELGAAETDVLQLAISHAGKDAVKGGYPHHMALLSQLQCILQKVLGAHRPPHYATLVVDNISEEEELPQAA